MKYVIKWIIGWILSLRYNNDKDKLFFLIWGHIGEAVYSLSLLPELKKIKNKSIVIVTHSPYSQIAELYKDYCDDIIVLRARNLVCIKEYSKSHICFHKNYIGNGWDWDDTELYLDIPDVYLSGMNYKIKDLKIPYTTKHSLISNYVSESSSEFNALIKKYNVEKGKSVLLIPYAQSAKELPISLWERIALELSNMGYKVYTNVKNSSECEIKGTIPIQIPLKLIPTFIPYAGSSISIRCGLTDLIAVTNSDVEVLYKIDNEVDEMLSGIWSYKLGKENILYRNKWFFRNEEDEGKFIIYIRNKYGKINTQI